MIHSLSFTNFYSFKNKVTIDFVVDKNAPDTDAYYTDAHNNRISKLMTVVGANASGKTNLLKSLLFLKWFITDSFSDLGPDDEIQKNFRHFLFSSEDTPSEFELVFAIKEELYRYELILTKESVLKETLSSKNFVTKHFNILFERKCEGKVCKNNFQRLGVTTEFEKILRTNSSVISTANQIGNPLAVKVVEYFSAIQSSFDDNDKNGKKLPVSIGSAAKFFHSAPDMKEKAEKIIQRFDLGIHKFSIEEISLNNGTKMFFPIAHHKHNDSDVDVPLALYEESGGTKNLFVLLKDILIALETGQMVIFDELDNNLHPLMVPEIINLFRSKNHNPKNAQLFFSTHNPQILSELHKTQIVIVEKNEKNISEAWKLSDIEGVRPNENYVTKYLAGVYGGIPNF